MKNVVTRSAGALLLATSLTLPCQAQDDSRGAMPATGMSKTMPSMGEVANPPAAPSAGATGATKTLPNLSERAQWPDPVADNQTLTFLLLDLLEYQRINDVDALRWAILGWRGGDVRRFWFKSEGTKYLSARKGSVRDGGEADVQFLYGKLIAPFFDFQMGLRFEQHYEAGRSPTRFFAVVALQGLAPYRFEIEPELFLSNKGKLSARFTASYDALLSQRLILQPRFETELAFQKDEEFGVASGVSDVELSLRLRYEIRREFAPYVGVSYRQSLGATRTRVRREGGAPNQLQLVAGVRAWF